MELSFLRAVDALPSDVALEYSVELADADNQSKGQSEFDSELLKTYDFKHEVGSGNFAKVWLTVHKQTGMACACKVINKKRHLFSAGLTKVFEREIDIMKQLRHENIVPLHELHIDKDRIHIFMEYLEGGDLFTYISDNGPFAESDCRPLFRQLCSAVRYLHSNGITHRDIKLDNILIKGISNGTISLVKIADFGLARAVGDGDMMRTICGTPSYLAPEIVCRGSSSTSYSKSVDIWALGVVLYALHINSFPFPKMLLTGGPGGSSLEMYSKSCKMNAGNEKYTSLSKELQNLLASMLQIDPEQRISIDAIIHHPWTQTSADGTPGLAHESAEIWGALKVDLVRPNEQQHASIDLFRRETIIGRGRQSHIQIIDPRVSSQHCRVIFRDSCIHLCNTSRSLCWIGNHPLANGQTRVLSPPYEFVLFAAQNGKDKSAQRLEYRFRVEVFDKPWKVTWVAAERSGDESRQIIPPSLVLPVKSLHLSHLPFGQAKNIYAVNGRLLLDPTSDELGAAVGDTSTQPWMVLSVLNYDFPRLHAFDKRIQLESTIRIEDSHISQTHCVIEYNGDMAHITNHSSNGTFVNSKIIEGTLNLAQGDEIVLLYDRIGTDSDDRRWLGQEQVIDGGGYPVLVGYRVVALGCTDTTVG
ncbi:hypothetical protein GGH20_000826 [Coemansia sp. RSA 1937]|nr:hypothetical protein GGH20_000826 [Coemansia sp. RSA 1937]